MSLYSSRTVQNVSEIADATNALKAALIQINISTSSAAALAKLACDLKITKPLSSYTISGDPPNVVYTCDTNEEFIADGHIANQNHRVLLDQNLTNSADAGIFVVTDTGSSTTPWQLTRAQDSLTLPQGSFTFVLYGATELESQFVMTTPDVVVGTTPQGWYEFGAGALALNGDVTGITTNNTISNATVTGKLMTGYNKSAGTVTASDSILQAIGRLDGNISTVSNTITAGTTMTGDVTGLTTNNKISNTTVTSKLLTGYSKSSGTVTASDSVLQAIGRLDGNITAQANNVGTPDNTPDTLVKRDANGSFSAGIITSNGPMYVNSPVNKSKIISFGSDVAPTDQMRTDYYGFGIMNNALSYYIPGTWSSHNFCVSTNSGTNSKILAKIQGDGTFSCANIICAGPLSVSLPAKFYGTISTNNQLQHKVFVLWDDPANVTDQTRNDYYGFGVQGDELRYHVVNSGASHNFYSGNGINNPPLLMSVGGGGTVNIPGTLSYGKSVRGTFTPTFVRQAATPPTMAGEFGYVLTGEMCYVQYRITWNTSVLTSDIVAIQLPFETVDKSSGFSRCLLNISYVSGINTNGAPIVVTTGGDNISSTNVLLCGQNLTGGLSTQLTFLGNFSKSGELHMFGTYVCKPGTKLC
jgi:hypothetical protein